MDTLAPDFALELNALSIIGLVALGLVVGLLSGLFGVGGGFLLTPMLNAFLGIPYNLAVGSTLVQMALMTWVGTRQHFKLGHVDHKLGLSMMAGSFFGAEAGVRIQGALRGIGPFELSGHLVSGFDLSMSLIYLALLGSIGLGMVIEGRRARRHAGEQVGLLGVGRERPEAATSEREQEPLVDCEPKATAVSRWLAGVRTRPVLMLSSDPSRRFSFWIPAGIGFVVSILTGLLGTGGGFLNMPILIYALGVPTVVAVGTASLQTTVAAIYSGVRHLMVGNVVWALVVSILAGSLLGARTGAALSERIPRDRLRCTFGYIVLGAALVVVVDVVRNLA